MRSSNFMGSFGFFAEYQGFLKFTAAFAQLICVGAHSGKGRAGLDGFSHLTPVLVLGASPFFNQSFGFLGAAHKIGSKL